MSITMGWRATRQGLRPLFFECHNVHFRPAALNFNDPGHVSALRCQVSSCKFLGILKGSRP